MCRRTETSLAVSANGRDWIVLNATLDIRQQIAATPALQPVAEGEVRNSPIKAVVVTSAEIDAVVGLLCMRERQPFTLYAADAVLEALADNPIFNVLASGLVARKAIKAGHPIEAEGDGMSLGLTMETFDVPGKIPLYLEADGDRGLHESGSLGLKITHSVTGRSFFFIPGCASFEDGLRRRLGGAAVVFFDGTLFRDDELLLQGLSEKTGRRMGHMSMSGPDGTIAAFARLGVARKIFIHINTSNPTLIDGSAERLETERAGWELAYDGMEISL